MSNPTIGFGNSSMAPYPVGGGHWAVRVHYMRWLQANGYRFYWFELLWEPQDLQIAEKLQRMFLRRMHALGLSESVFLLRYPRGVEAPMLTDFRCANRSQADFQRAVEQVDLLFNFCCALRQPFLGCFPRKALLDLDPGHLHVSALDWPMDIEQHDVLFTVGTKLHDPDCESPVLDRHWRRFLPPVYLPDWPAAPPAPQDAPFSSMTQWTWAELWWGQRVLSVSKRQGYLRYVELPSRVKARFELAVNLSPDDCTGDRELLLSHGWELIHPHRVARSPGAYRRYIHGCRAEFGCAKPIHNELRTGWFSDRTAAFLASGRPALVEETGFSDHLPTGEGLLTFRNLDEAAEGVRSIQANYRRHCEAARGFAERFLDADRIMPAIIELGLSPATAPDRPTWC